MGTIKENINYIIDYQKRIGYYMPKIVNPPASDKEIKKIEDELGMKFNNELKELFKTLNGIYLDYKTASGLTGIIPIHDLLDLKRATKYYRSMDWDMHWEFYYDVFETEYKIGEKLFPFIHDGAGNCYWVDLNEGTKNYGRLYWTNTFGEEDGYLFNSVTDFFQAIKNGYEKGIFNLEEEGYLDCDYKKWGEICYELDKSNKYWKDYVN